MKSIFVCSFLMVLSFSANAQKTIDKIAAQVGDNIILLSDIQAQKLQAIQAQVEVTAEMDCEILEQLLYQKLLLTQAELDSIIVPEAQVDAEMEQRLRVIQQQIGGRQKLEEFYGKTINEIKAEFFKVISEQLTADEMERTITMDVAVTPREVKRFYDDIPLDSLPLINEQMMFRQIVIYPDITEEDKNRAYNKLKEIRNSIVKQNRSFEAQARVHSEDPGSAQYGGRIEATKGMMVPQFEATAYSLKKGEVSEIFETTYGYHIMKLLDRKGDDYVCQHILITPKFEDSGIERAALRLDSCYNQLVAGTITWEEAVLKYSNDESTKQNKGTITNPYTGDVMWDAENLSEIDRDIYLLTDKMEPGDYSMPSLYVNQQERKQGVRIVQLVKRTKPHSANLGQDYALITRAAEADKKQKVINEWINAKINNAYIRIDEDYQNCNFRNEWLKEM
ncbi:MAG: peptidylprolyl isomerase [bacterium]|nr:peptidylprolyl isomerase [bacterium]